jgi:tRNA(Ile)-lysidine synthase
MWRGAEAGHSSKRVADAIGALPARRYVLAVSGGRDSMALLDSFVRWRTDAVAVATFDHGTGVPARRAAQLVEREAERRGLRFVSARRGRGRAATEEEWRAARWGFLGGASRELHATVVTAHTRDDQLETVVMRALRDARHTSARGLAAMYARSRLARPFIDTSRGDLATYVRDHRVRFVEDPTNESRAYLRNRVRLELLPALEQAHPGFAHAMLHLSRRAARWRAGVEDLVESLGSLVSTSVVVPADILAALPAEGLAVLWPAIAARAGVALDRRGTERLVAFTKQSEPGGRVPLSGGAEVRRTPATFVLRASDDGEALYSIV